MDIYSFIVPTGIGASIGGFAGDAGAYARMLAEKYTLIVNPNVVNAACFSAITDNMLYVEGYAIDLFYKGEIALRKSLKNKIGVIFDRAIPNDVLNIHLNTLDAISAVYGIDTIYEFTQKDVGVEFTKSTTGISTGNVKNPETLFEAAEKLISKGCNALAPVCLFEDSEEDDDNYENGEGIDIVGGVEAVISHLLTRKFLLPVAHAPAFKKYDITSRRIHKKAAAEYITPTFLPCIILGLYNAPQLIKTENKTNSDIFVKDLKGTILPFNSLGGIPAFKSAEYNIPIFAIKENKSMLNITKDIFANNFVTETAKYKDL